MAAGRGILLVLLLAAAAFAGSDTAAAAVRPADEQVRVATTGDYSELFEKLPIRRSRDSGSAVAMSLDARKLRGLEPGDGFKASAELQVTVDCDEPQPRCLGSPYHYNPAIDTRLVLAKRRGATSGITVGRPKHEICRQQQPNREHHCVIVFTGARLRIRPRIPCLRSRCHLNLVVDAHSPHAHRGEFIALGGLKPNGDVPQDRGRLNAIRFRAAAGAGVRPVSTDNPVTDRLHLDQRREVVFSRPLPPMRDGDELDVSARARVDISKLPYNVVLSSQLVVTTSRKSIRRGRASKLVSLRGEVSEGNGFNCTRNKGVCTIRKVGIARMRRDAVRHGRPTPLFISLLTRAGPKQLEAASWDRAVIRGGRLKAIRYRDEAR